VLISWAQKKAGPEMATLNLHSQPRLPGSVVGKWSMGERQRLDKITEEDVQK
jgi:hypothetical protein